MDFKERVPFGSTGFRVSRLGLASGYGVPAASIEKAFHEYGINYLYISPLLNLGNMIHAIHNLAPDHRDELCIVLARPMLAAFRLEKYVDRWLRKLKLERIDLLLQGVRNPPSHKLVNKIQRLKEDGKVRFVGVSSHNRPLLGEIASGANEVPLDFFHVRYNAVHTGAEEEVFPRLTRSGRQGVGVYTATCWRKLLTAKNMPNGEHPLTAADCYRFVLTHPDVSVCLTAPSTDAQMAENLRALEAGSLNEEEMRRVRRIGQHIYAD